LSRFAAGFTQPSPAPPQQQIVSQPYAAPEEPAETPRIAPPKPPRVSKVSRRERERPLAAPPPATTGAAERQQDQPQPAAEKDEKPTTPVNVADREALYQDFMKWQRNRTAYGVRW
jgi:hypothetical protein